jgi:hypothetical protein
MSQSALFFLAYWAVFATVSFADAGRFLGFIGTSDSTIMKKLEEALGN